jgi:hypothetical protein
LTFSGTSGTRAASGIAVKATAAGLLFVMLAGLGVAVAITLYNKPRFLIPPGVRDEPGLLQDDGT